MGNGLCAQPEDLEPQRCKGKTHVGKNKRKCSNQDKPTHGLCDACSFEMQDGKRICKDCWKEAQPQYQPKPIAKKDLGLAAVVSKQALKKHQETSAPDKGVEDSADFKKNTVSDGTVAGATGGAAVGALIATKNKSKETSANASEAEHQEKDTNHDNA